MENFANLSHSNPYLNSKREASELFEETDFQNYIHLQMHTLYGGENISPSTFLGQVADALMRNQPFKMSAGNQLREYHHLEDDVAAISEVINSGASGKIEISHGQPVTLRLLAETIFRSIGKLELLEVGMLASNSFENNSYVFDRNLLYNSVNFRSALENVPKWIGESLAKGNKK
jgi:nucleoside-diphosphate-sugar epimerase